MTEGREDFETVRDALAFSHPNRVYEALDRIEARLRAVTEERDQFARHIQKLDAELSSTKERAEKYEKALRELARSAEAECRDGSVIRIAASEGRSAVNLAAWDRVKNSYGDEMNHKRATLPLSLAMVDALHVARTALTSQMKETD